MSEYFTGRDVSSKKLVLSDATNFHDLVQRLVNMPVPLSIEREAYHALPKAERDKAKQVGYIVPCTFPESPWYGRLLENAGECNILFLDIDPLKDGTCPAAPFVERPSVIAEKIGRFNFAAYKTISCTEESPRLRIMVDAKGIPVDQYPDAVLSLAQMLGLSHVSRESAVAVQPMYRPSVFSDQDAEFDHPLIATGFTGRAFTVDDIADDLDSLPGMVSAARTSRVRKTGDAVDDYLLFFQQPVPEITIEVATEALAMVNPDCGYFEWLEMAAALKHQFGSSENESDAFILFDEWSAKGSKYAGQKDTAAKWKSLVEQPRGRAPITIRSLLKRAVESGWDAGEVKQECFESVKSWISFECKSGTQLMAEGVKRIAATPLLTHTEEDALLQTLVCAARSKFEEKLSVTALRKDLKRCRSSVTATNDETQEMVVLPFARGVVYVASTNQFCRHRNRQFYNEEAFNNVYSRWLLPTPEELQSKDVEVNQTTLNTPKYEPSKYLLNHLKCQTVDDVDYDPASPQDIITKREGKLFLNIYRRSYPESDKDMASYAEDIFVNHLCNLIAESEYRSIVMDWIAHNIQHPGAKIRWAVLLQGAEGCGKTFIFECMRAMLGNDNVRLINTSSIKRGWNEWTFGSQLVTIEEIRVAGQNRHDIMNVLKEPITNDYITVNERNRNTRMVRNVTNYLAFTNHHDALALSEESRRWMILKALLQKEEQVRELWMKFPNYFSELFDMLVTHAAGLRWFFENRTISDRFNPGGSAPRTKYLAEMIFDTGNELTSVLHRIWEDGDNPMVRPDVIAATSLMHALEMENIRSVSPQHLASVLRDAGFTRLEGRHRINGERQYVWFSPHKTLGKNPLELLDSRVSLESQNEDPLW